MSLSTSLCLLTCLIAFSQTLPAPESGKGLIDTIQDSFKDLVGKQAEATASGLCNTDGSGLTRDSCERKNYLEYCDKTYALERRCRYKPWAWAIIIGVPVLGVVLLSAIICVCLKGRGSSA